MMRLALAVVTGYLLVAISSALLFQLSGQDPHAAPSLSFGITSIACTALSSALAGFVASRIAPQARLLASLVVGCLLAIGLWASLVHEATNWATITGLVMMLPSACAGGLISLRMQR